MSLISFGEALIDFLSDGNSPPQYTQFPGGAPANVAVAYSQLGGRAYFIGGLSNDIFGQFLVNELQKYQVKTDYCYFSETAQTAMAFVSLDKNKERSFNFYRNGTADLLFRSKYFSINPFKNSQLFHFCSNTLVDPMLFHTTLSGLKLAEQNQCLRSFDLNFRPLLWPDNHVNTGRIWQIIKQTDILKMSVEECEYLLQHTPGLNDKQGLIKRCIQQGVKLIVLTNGANKLYWHTRQHQGSLLPEPTTVVDTTAAGDAFMGGLLWSIQQYLAPFIQENPIHVQFKQMLQQIDILHNQVAFAAQCGTSCVTKKGAFPSFLSTRNKEIS